MARDNVIPIIGSILATCAIAYMAVTQQPLVIDAGPGEHQLSFPEKLFAAVTVLFTFATIFISMRRAYRAGSKFWFFLSIIAWPASFFYTLLINRSDES